MRFTATRAWTFDAAHFLPEHPGKCSRMHGHTYKVEVTARQGGGGIDAATGMVVDFGYLDLVAQGILRDFDHSLLNDRLALPTAENVAECIAHCFINRLPEGLRIVRVRLWETPDCFVEVECDA